MTRIPQLKLLRILILAVLIAGLLAYAIDWSH